MIRGICLDCGELIEITPTGKVIADGWSAKYWRLIMHATKRDGPLRETICEGSGKLI